MNKIVIVGGGCSGIVAGIFAKNDNNEVIILERNNTPLKKLLMTGNGRCNYMNEVYSTNQYYSSNIDIVDKIISTNNIEDMRSFFDYLGIIPKIRNGYYYPFSNQAITIKNVLLGEAKRVGVEIVCDTLVKDINSIDNKFIVNCNNHNIECDKVVLATGSCAYPKTGSDGMGYTFLEKFGHSIIKPLPALVPLISNFPYSKEWDGVRSEVRLELFEDGKYKESEEGEVQLTSYGVSGICTFNLSHIISRGLDAGRKEVLKINFVPFIDTLITPWLDNYSKKHYMKNLGELLEGFLNIKIVSVILKFCNLKKNMFYQDLSNDNKLLLCKSLRSFPLEIIGTKSFDNAQICNGGVRLEDISYTTMESKIIPNLYILGELLDMNGICGGYNLSLCWISGMLAGKAIGGINDSNKAD